MRKLSLLAPQCKQETKQKREQDIAEFAITIILPAPDASVLEHHVNRECVEEDKIAKKDAVHEAGDLVVIATCECMRRSHQFVLDPVFINWRL